jgi:hypothetical protein
MKGRITLAIYIAIGLIPVCVGPAAVGQSSVHVRSPAPDRGWAPVMPETTDPLEVVVIRYGQGGLVAEHDLRYGAYKRAKSKVEVRGPCYSACTLITAYIGKDDLCFAEGAFLAFHAVRKASTKELMPAATAMMYWQQPADIRDWIDRTGGHQRLPLDGYWPLYDRDPWAMGYPKCK